MSDYHNNYAYGYGWLAWSVEAHLRGRIGADKLREALAKTQEIVKITDRDACLDSLEWLQ